MGIDFETAGSSLDEMRFYASVYFDALTKDLLIQRLLLIRRAATLSVFAIAQGFTEAGRSPEATSNLLHLIPPAGGRLAATG
jgi:hypothetical protein